MTELEKRSLRAKELLQQAVAETLERKRRLGQYAIISKDGKPVRIEPQRENNKESR